MMVPAELSRHERLRVRFMREAKAISALAHPNICALHDIGRENGIDFLGLEYVEGPTLAERLRTGPLPIDVVLWIEVEIAEALEKAHPCGIVHRDLKPGNVIARSPRVSLSKLRRHSRDLHYFTNSASFRSRKLGLLPNAN